MKRSSCQVEAPSDAEFCPDCGVSLLVARHAEGKPPFVEELAKALAVDGTLDRADEGYRLARPHTPAHIPGTIQGVIMAHIDRLPEASKTALPITSVIGRGGRSHILAATAPVELAQVVRLFIRIGRPTWG